MTQYYLSALRGFLLSKEPKTYGTEIYDDVTWLDTNFDVANRKIALALISAIDKESH